MAPPGGGQVRPGALVAEGRTSDVYEFGNRAVVKVPRPRVPDHWAQLEAGYTRAIAVLDVPAPRVLDMIDVDGRTSIVFERVDGHTMWQRMCDDPGRVEELACVLADTHRRILSAGPPDGLDGLFDRVISKICEGDGISEDDCRDAAAVARSLPTGAALLHGDLHPENVVMTADGPVVIDWFDASIGHPVGDVVRSSLLMRPFGDRADKPHLPDAGVHHLRRLHDAYVGAMADVLAVEDEELRRWESVMALGRLAEGRLPDHAALAGLWRARNGGGPSSALRDCRRS